MQNKPRTHFLVFKQKFHLRTSLPKVLALRQNYDLSICGASYWGIFVSEILLLSHSRIVLRMYLLRTQGFLLAGRGAHCNCWSLSRQTHTLEPWKLLRTSVAICMGLTSGSVLRGPSGMWPQARQVTYCCSTSPGTPDRACCFSLHMQLHICFYLGVRGLLQVKPS